jgi:YesN/AraC family two-component response regulator
LVSKGTGKLAIEEKEYELKPGTLFLVAPWQFHEIKDFHDFTYLYISFNGQAVPDLLKKFGYDNKGFVLNNFEHLIEFWIKSIRRITPENDTVLTDSVLKYTFSFLSDIKGIQPSSNGFDSVIQYINDHYREPSLTMKKVADLFFYSYKYFSYVFKEKTGVRFTEYLNNMRIHLALQLIEEKPYSITELAIKCGFGDSYYFSKVFKSVMNKTPTQFLREKYH